MIKTIEATGKTEDEAIESVLEQLKLTRDDISVEIVERAKTGFLGLKSSPAVIRVRYEEKDEEEHEEKDAEKDSASLRLREFLDGLLARMDIEAGIEITEQGSVLNVDLTGKDPRMIIGHRGETLDAIQHLSNYVINRGGSGRVRVNVDTENYRHRRNETVENLAKRTAERVIRYRKNMTLNPMNAYERHLVHTVLQEVENVSTYSVGSEPNRRIVVAYGRIKNGGGKENYRDKRLGEG